MNPKHDDSQSAALAPPMRGTGIGYPMAGPTSAAVSGTAVRADASFQYQVSCRSSCNFKAIVIFVPLSLELRRLRSLAEPFQDCPSLRSAVDCLRP
ncbi:unnamed protein product [Prorocentrum cordatum]|nr:unnamed protein product [Polarella glacialis]